MDILAAAKQSDKYNFHSHTQFCDGRDNMYNFALAAVENRFLHYGFTPHSPVPIESPCNMSMESVPLFIDEVNRLRDIFTDRINLYIGMEIDYLGKDWGPSHSYFKSLPLDYSIGSVHFIPTQEGELVDIDGQFDSFAIKMEEKFHGDIRYVVDCFYKHSHDMIGAGGFDIIGHFDKIGHNAAHYSPGIEDTPWYHNHITEMIEHIASAGIIAEINTKAYEGHGRLFPNQRYIQRVLDAGIPVIVNSDAHYPDRIDSSRDIALNKVKATSSI